MRTASRTSLAILLIAILPGLLAAQEKSRRGKKAQKNEPVALFNGEDLEGWGCHLVDPNVKMEDVWSVKDGILICKGEPLGYLHTTKDYKNFRLTLQWRWPAGKAPGNSGVLLRATGEPIGFMPRCMEAQLKSGSAGDIWAFRGYPLSRSNERFREVKDHEALGDFPGVAALKNAEKEPGQWNTYQIVFRNDKLRLRINDQKVNEAAGCDVVAGKICLQSEGAEIHFRKIQLTPLD